MDRLLQQLADFVGREWAQRWLEHLRRNEEARDALGKQRPEVGEQNHSETSSGEPGDDTR